MTLSKVAWVFDAEGKRNIWLKKMFEIRGDVASPAWSPDGSQLAFVSGRGDHSFIAIYENGPAPIRFLEPSTDRDIEPRWPEIRICSPRALTCTAFTIGARVLGAGARPERAHPT